jgi:maltooligosyltrehalose trehalohydrolase
MHDASDTHIIAELSGRVRAAAHPRSIILVAENEPQHSEYLAPAEDGGYGLDAMWNDDFHHSARVALTGRHEGYYHDYCGRAQEFVSAVKRGFLYQGQYYHWQKKPRGTPIKDAPAWALIAYIQNHDQVGNTLYGERLHELTSPGRLRAMTALLLLGPHTPMLFMGQEFAASQPFAFFADHKPELAQQVHAGRREFLQQFTTYATPSAQERVPDPADESTFLASKIDLSECDEHGSVYALHADLLRIRREDAVLAMQLRTHIDGAVLGEHAFVLRWFGEAHGDRLLVVNLGSELKLEPAPEPLLAPPLHGKWEMLWSSDEPRYDGPGALTPCTDTGWLLPGESAVLLASR